MYFLWTKMKIGWNVGFWNTKLLTREVQHLLGRVFFICSFEFNSPINNENASFLGKPLSIYRRAFEEVLQHPVIDGKWSRDRYLYKWRHGKYLTVYFKYVTVCYIINRYFAKLKILVLYCTVMYNFKKIEA